MAVTNGLVQIVCNATLQRYGGDLYVAIMTVIHSVREIVQMPVSGLGNGTQPVIGFNYGAGKYKRVRSAIRFSTIFGVISTTAFWALMFFFPEFFLRLFTGQEELVRAGVPVMRLYFFGFFMMSLQFSGQSVFVALGKSRQAIFFSLLRKAFIVVPLTLLLPRLFDLGVKGVFLAEPVSNFIGGAACFTTMMLTVWPALKEKDLLERTK